MPAWLDNAVFYEIYPQSFFDTNGDGIGDIPGITRKLGYVQGLGCNAIWLNPCFDSPFFDAGYDVSDYCKVAPRYGTNEDLKELFAAAHARGMHVILDLVPGHTSFRHPWFQESMKAERNAYTDRYVWTDDIWKGFEGCRNINGCLRGISDRNGSCAVNYYSTQPALNYGFAQVTESWQQPVDAPGPRGTVEAMKDVMRFWLAMGCDGFRVDMAGSLVKADADGQATVALWREFRAFLDKEFPEAAMISEWGEPDKSLAGGFHMDFLLHFGPSRYLSLFRENPYFSRKGTGDVKAFVEKYLESYNKTDGKGLICIPSGNHDMHRIQETLDDEECKLAFAFLLSMPGAPFLYYGEELGMRYLGDLPSKEGGFERTGSRTPMQWDSTLNAGFSSAKPEDLYLPVDPSPDRPTVESQTADETSLYHEVKRLIAVRMAHEALQSNARVEFLYAEDHAYPLVYRRTGETESVLVLLNPSGKEASCPLPGVQPGEEIYSYHGAASFCGGRAVLPPCSASFFLL